MHRRHAGRRRPQDPAVQRRRQGSALLTGRIVLGLGGCVDWEITWHDTTIQALTDRHRITLTEIHRDVPVTGERTLLRSILGFLRDGAGGERFAASPEIVTSFAAHFPYRATLGGTNVRAALTLHQLRHPSTLHLVSINDTTRQLLPPGIDYLCSAEQDSTEPHLIVQYPAGGTVRLADGNVQAPGPNRLIYVNDRPNREMHLSPHLGDLLADADVFLISGFNSMQDAATLNERLTHLRHHMRQLPADALVIFEDGGYHHPNLARRVADGLAGLVDVHSMNEDELTGYLGRELNPLDPADMDAALREALQLLPTRTLLVHTRHGALAAGDDVLLLHAGLDSGTRAAAARYLHGDAITIAHHDAITRTARHPASVHVAQDVERLLPGRACCVPAFTLDTPTPTTVGLGDAFVGGFLAGLRPACPQE